MRFSETLGLSHTLKLIEHELTYKMDGLLKTYGFTSAQYTVLSCLESAGPLTNAELARKCHVTAQTMIRLTKALQEAKLIKMTDNDGGKKGGLILTKRAEDQICKAHVAVNELELSIVRDFSKKEITRAQDLLGQFLKNLRKTE